MAKMTKGPGGPGGSLPVNPLAAMVKAAIKRREEEKMSKITKGQGVKMSEPGRTMSSKRVGSQDYINEGQFDEMVKKVREGDKVNSQSRASGIKGGFFTEKNGDLVPTAKYNEYKKAGKLKSVGL